MCTNTFNDDSTSTTKVSIVLLFWGILGVIVMKTPLVDAQISGSIQKCENEGEAVFVPQISDNPCITCFCRAGAVECRREKCESLEGCYMILFDYLLSGHRKCCEVCKGCTVDGEYFSSNSLWTDKADPCTTYSCKAGVATRTTTKCYAPCANPVPVPGKCCPVCQSCQYDGKTYNEGDVFPLSTDLCTKCSCKNGTVSCEKETCPVLNCPKNVIWQPPGSCCKVCKGQRRIFNLPGGKCFFQYKIYKSGETFRPGNCTSCLCVDGTFICDRETCPPLPCPLEKTVQRENSCCRVCPDKQTCDYKNRTYMHEQQWRPNVCTACSCDDGSTRCHVQNCRNSVWCPSGYRLKYVDGECCPRCTEAKGVCTVFGDPHYRTFDGRIYNFQGPCKYLLAEDTVAKSFSIRVRNDARTSPWFTWTRMVTVFLGNVKIGLHQKMNVKVNRRRVKLPYTNHAEFSVVRDGQSVKVMTAIGLKVIWDGDSFVEVTIPSRYKQKMRGLCGNYNGISTDDLMGKDDHMYLDGENFGNTWRVGSKAACTIEENVQKTEPPCKSDSSKRKRAKRECSHLLASVFSRCRRKVDVRQYYRSCIADMCECPDDKQCACEAVKAYAHRCINEGVELTWNDQRFCPEHCPEGAIYRQCTKRCMRTCEERDQKALCKTKCSPGCACPGNRLLHNNKCIKPRQCPKRR
ncbi:BMP-binding endothelial regulator protein-like [Mizuhopecten yessoensis]|uniref:BMP-binding endothelial regulator protein n=1 Tax=Mizuhopecten yessoensis TaxID=6573 RepID=A0A210QS28_MIZYE|nr:BMP-binding endothelial regulator protein-like [Mizuhopecten yessoensis]OWF51557.1 BMP-binding endothelial regulator protein [Mizuhopecten yessoensis]